MGASLSVPGTETMLGAKGSPVTSFAHYPLPTTVAAPGSIVGTNLTSGSGTANTTFDTASITVAAGDFLVMYVGAYSGAGSIGTIPTPSGAGQTWVRPSVTYGAQFPDMTPSTTRRFAYFTAVGVSGSGAITINPLDGTYDCNWIITKFTGVDATAPLVWGSMLSTASNATSQTLLARKFRDATYNASVALCMSGNGADSNVVGSGYTIVGHTNVAPTSLASIMMEYKVGEDLVADWSWTGSASNLGFVFELRAANTAANPTIECLTIAKAGTGSNGTTITITAPVYTGAHPIYLFSVGMRTVSVAAHTVAGGGVTWTSHDSQTFDDTTNFYRLQMLRTMGPLDGSDVTITLGAQTQIGNDYWMVALPGADTSGSQGSGSVVQLVKSTDTTTTTPAVTLAANSNAANAVLMAAASTSASSTTVKIIGTDGLVSADHDQTGATDPLHGSPNCRLWVGFLPVNRTALGATWDASGIFAEMGVEIKSA